MTTLDDKLLGEKQQYYCSSSEGEDEEDSGMAASLPAATSSQPSAQALDRLGGSRNTGPKGVLQDWRLFQEHEREVRNQKERDLTSLCQQTALTCLTENQEEMLAAEVSEALELENDLYSEETLNEFLKKRMEALLKSQAQISEYNSVHEIVSGEEYLKLIDETNPRTTVVVHIFDTAIPECSRLNDCLSLLCVEYRNVNFCKIKASVAGVSQLFKTEGIPALLVYKGGNLIGNYIRLKEEFGSDFYHGDVENFLIENGILEDKNNIPTLLK